MLSFGFEFFPSLALINHIWLPCSFLEFPKLFSSFHGQIPKYSPVFISFPHTPFFFIYNLIVVTLLLLIQAALGRLTTLIFDGWYLLLVYQNVCLSSQALICRATYYIKHVSQFKGVAISFL